MKVNERIKSLRKLMAEKKLDAYLVYSSDSHQSEYVAECWRSRAFITGFTGSAGVALITMNGSALWTDGRYFIQAAHEIEGSEVELMKIAMPGVPTIPEWLSDNMPEGCRIGFDGRTVSLNIFKELQAALQGVKAEFVTEFDLIQSIWTDRPALPFSNVYPHDVKYAGKSFAMKLIEVRNLMKKSKAPYYFISSMDDIAWFFNLRGNDVANNPVFQAYSMISPEGVLLYIDEKRLAFETISSLANDGVKIVPYTDVIKSLSSICCNKVYIDPDRTSIIHAQTIMANNEIIEGMDFTTKLKGFKNSTEIACLKKTHKKDSIAVTKFIYWLKNNVGKLHMDEISVDEKLLQFREKGDLFMDRAFGTIAAYKSNAAMMHYSATPEKKTEIKAEGFLLVDSGGQYLDGTTDITRTIVLGPLTDEEKKDFTLVLKSHIALAKPRFLEGTPGGALDILARTPMWNEGLDYKCGTGHGVGFFLNVHEGPHSFKPAVKTPLSPGMVITNEPGIYKEKRHGIRTENTQLVINDIETEFGTFYTFETLSFVPIDLDGIIPEMLTPYEKTWINEYHETCLENLLPHMADQEEKDWLKKYTRAI